MLMSGDFQTHVLVWRSLFAFKDYSYSRVNLLSILVLTIKLSSVWDHSVHH